MVRFRLRLWLSNQVLHLFPSEVYHQMRCLGPGSEARRARREFEAPVPQVVGSKFGVDDDRLDVVEAPSWDRRKCDALVKVDVLQRPDVLKCLPQVRREGSTEET